MPDVGQEPMPTEIPRIRHHVPASYLDIARAMLTEIHAYPGADPNSNDYAEQANRAIFAAMSVSVVFSYQAVEAFCNSQLYSLWAARDGGDERAVRFRGEFPRAGKFSEIKQLKLSDKLKKLSVILGIRKPSESCDTTWNTFKQLAEVARHFLVHPNPEEFSGRAREIMETTQAGLYVRVAENLMGHFFTETGAPIPLWLKQPTVLTGRGFNVSPPSSVDKETDP